MISQLRNTNNVKKQYLSDKISHPEKIEMDFVKTPMRNKTTQKSQRKNKLVMQKSEYFGGIQSLLDAASILDKAEIGKKCYQKSDPYLRTQIITYMGNKRKIIKHIDDAIAIVKEELGVQEISTGDGFSGSGIVSRLLKIHSHSLHVNDISGYSETLNKCYLASPSEELQEEIKNKIQEANIIATEKNCGRSWISKHWSPKSDKIEPGERAYYTHENGRRIDVVRNYIDTLPERIQPFILAPLLVASSVNNNTNGQFSAYFKDEQGIGSFGGKKQYCLSRITKNINIETPIFCDKKCDVNITKMDTNKWATELPELDLVYYDPPYNKHAYSVYYFMLDIINNWDLYADIPDTNRGQPKNWIKSQYNSFTNAKQTLLQLISNTRSKYILLSYNSCGIIPINELDISLQQFGHVRKIPIEHKTYNRLKGIGNYKRKDQKEKNEEFLWLIRKI